MARVIESTYYSKKYRIGIVVSRFNELITKALLDGSLNELRRAGIAETNIEVIWVPGAHEIPLACQTLLMTKRLHGVIAVGCIIRGETSHYEHLAQSVTDAIQNISLEQRLPIGLAVLTVENMAQAMDRSGGKQGNKGRDAARSMLEMVDVIDQLKNEQKKEVKFKQFVDKQFKKQ